MERRTRSALGTNSPSQDRIRFVTTWSGVGGSPESVSASSNDPLMLAIIGATAHGRPFVAFPSSTGAVDSVPFRSACTHRDTSRPPTSRRARSCAAHERMRDRIGAERGLGPMTRAEFDQHRPTLAVLRFARHRRSQVSAPRDAGLSRFE